MPTYIRLTDYKSSDEKEKGFFDSENRYEAKQEDFEKIPGSPIAYWVSDRVKEIFEKSEKLEKIATPRQGLATTNNDLFLRLWYEISFENIGFKLSSDEAFNSGLTWFPFNKGGEFRKWFGNIEHLVNWFNGGEDIKQSIITKYPYLNGNPGFVAKNPNLYFKSGVTWSAISSGNFSVRIQEHGTIFSNAGMSAFPDYDKLNWG
jgi:hypothetical protein